MTSVRVFYCRLIIIGQHGLRLRDIIFWHLYGRGSTLGRGPTIVVGRRPRGVIFWLLITETVDDARGGFIGKVAKWLAL